MVPSSERLSDPGVDAEETWAMSGEQLETRNVARRHARLMGNGGGDNRQVAGKAGFRACGGEAIRLGRVGTASSRPKIRAASASSGNTSRVATIAFRPRCWLGRPQAVLRNLGDAILALRDGDGGESQVRRGLRGKPCLGSIWSPMPEAPTPGRALQLHATGLDGPHPVRHLPLIRTAMVRLAECHTFKGFRRPCSGCRS
jgi:hypothetical protein